MNEISALESRLEAALERIGTALRTPAPVSDELQIARAEVDRLGDTVARLTSEVEATATQLAEAKQALDEEVLVTKQLKARNEALHAKLDAAEAEAERLRGELAARDALTGQFRRVNAQLRQNNLMLREANAKGLPDAHLINKAMLTELESIRASRDAERVEIDAVLAELKPLIGEGADA
ncbi:hypothetical protein [Frigidibacter sp. ROC022]|uniref:hypothetical protein n=1 Tax=Frigidibacter sp. ROC022 TaxID=2971796 RepID=UPI00215A28FC|nr:hypothetical protein [Frigidibacter sp. ROC022]MCR8723779.1 hypothetical protein [Frigidibacter sp. ROC022]